MTFKPSGVSWDAWILGLTVSALAAVAAYLIISG